MTPTVNIETLLRKLPSDAFSLDAQRVVDELFAKADPLTPAQRKLFLAAAERALRVRREILNLAAYACGHRPRSLPEKGCRTCSERWPCPEVLRTAAPALDALAELKA